MLDATTLSLVFRKGRQGQVGAERIALLEAVRDQGSLALAAKQVGLSYKGAWDAVQTLNNLFEQPLINTQVGGRRGGATTVTDQGLAVIAAFHKVQAELAQVMTKLETGLANVHPSGLTSALWSLGMKTSARNALRGVVESITDGAVNAEVTVRIATDARIVAVVTRHSIEDLGLAPGRAVIALIKSSFIVLAWGKGDLRTSARNSLPGTVVRREDGVVNSEIGLELADGKVLTATVTLESAKSLDLRVGVAATALIKASHIILAVE